MELGSLSAEDQGKQLVDMLTELATFSLPSAEDGQELVEEGIELDEELLRRGRQFFGFLMPSLYNQIALMVHHRSMFDLVGEALQGSDSSLLKAVQIDPTVLNLEPLANRARSAGRNAEASFVRRLEEYQQKPMLESRYEYLPLYLILWFLELTGWLGKRPHKDIFELCDELGVYGEKDGTDVGNLSKLIRRFQNRRRR
jgi:hypothetical protein